VAGLVRKANGVLFGTTQLGGVDYLRLLSCGTVFELLPPNLAGGVWKESVILTLDCRTEGAYPDAGLIIVGNRDVLYGTTAGGQNPYGVYPGSVFSLTPPTIAGAPWTTPFEFGASSNGLIDSKGVLYGTTTGSTVYSFTP
jgi:hypothetical protein